MQMLLGDGVRLFAGPDATPVRRKKVSVAESGLLTDLRSLVERERS